MTVAGALAGIYLIGVVMGLAVMRDAWPSRLVTAALWPLGLVAFAAVRRGAPQRHGVSVAHPSSRHRRAHRGGFPRVLIAAAGLARRIGRVTIVRSSFMSGPAQPKKSKPFDRSLIEGPISPAVWKLAWPTMIQNLVAGLQGLVDHALVGHLIGFTANAAIGVSWQIFLVVIVFMASLFTGQAVLVARFAGAGDSDRVNLRRATGVHDRDRDVSRARAGRLLRDAVAARSAQRGAGRQGARAAVPAHHVRLEHRHADVLHAQRGAARGGRRAHAAASRRDDDRAERRAERDSHQRPRSDSSAGHGRLRARDRRLRPARSACMRSITCSAAIA